MIQNGTVTANYIRTMNIDEPLMRIKSDGTIRFYKTDALGSVIALTVETGAVRTTYSYDPFGNVTISGEASDNSFQYTGRENDNTGLYYYRARYYNPELQRFISEDPIELAGGDVNFYAYVWNQPLNWIDPEGLRGKGSRYKGADRKPPYDEGAKGFFDKIGELPNFNMGGEWQYGIGRKCKRYSCSSCQNENVKSKDGITQCHKTKKCSSEDVVPPFIASPGYEKNCVCIEWDVEVYKW